MADGLEISGGGALTVATDELMERARSLDRVTREAEGCAGQVAGILMLGAGRPPDAATRELERAGLLLGEVRTASSRTATALRSAADNYDRLEFALQRAGQQLTATLGYAAGWFLPTLAFLVLPASAIALAGLFGAAVLFPRGAIEAAGALGDWLRAHRGVLSSPFTVALLRSAVSSVDDTGAGLARLPPGLALALGEEGFGVAGVGTSAAAIALVGARFGVFAETPVTVRPTVRSLGAQPPRGIADRIGRVPDPKGNAYGEQIVIERYSIRGMDRFEVYLGGTVDFSPVAGTEVWDLTSNVHAVAELPAGSYRAAREALADAGVMKGSPIVFTGYSQGGLIATALAASGDYSPQGLITVGAPAGQIPVPAGIPTITIEHTDDLVPAFGGTRVNHDAVLVERQAFGGVPLPDDRAVPAHDLAVYRRTAELADGAGSEKLARAVESIDWRDTVTRSTSTSYLAERGGD
ncbi:hypothetical protein EYE40_12370 [Glaciihabitans arcticus]|uniref:Alpha/beta hydrolase n=1 Tax=Glaciihabitans arcticus TaxID=2668039 RepID=A0A4Q9GTS0_9MICO|nr:hypothetical protein [Glaciihabitans arcticus]TBN58121.1 hypothetical protein EYE40_12370 [Glaciihabitans arcticus]